MQSASPENRPNPLVWTGEEEAQGVFVGTGEDPALIGVPGGLRGPSVPRLPADFVPEPELIAVFDKVATSLGNAAQGATAPVIDLKPLDETQRQAAGEILGEGEVSVVAGSDPVWQVQESVLAGVWRVRAGDDAGGMVADYIEIADVPSVVRNAASALTRPMSPVGEASAPGTMNAPSVLAEVRARAEAYEPGQRNHVINFTLFPLTEADSDLISAALGQVPLTIVSGGFGTCRIMATRVRHVWAVQFVNAMGNVILDTLEIGDVPDFARAAREDFEDSAERLSEIMEAYLT